MEMTNQGRENGEPDRIRTCDPLIKSQLLYQLSYGPTICDVYNDLDAHKRARQRRNAAAT